MQHVDMYLTSYFLSVLNRTKLSPCPIFLRIFPSYGWCFQKQWHNPAASCHTSVVGHCTLDQPLLVHWGSFFLVDHSHPLINGLIISDVICFHLSYLILQNHLQWHGSGWDQQEHCGSWTRTAIVDSLLVIIQDLTAAGFKL